MIKFLIGGSPCTNWSIAQKNNRETQPEGIGWELFKNYLIAKEKFKPDFFLYENNKSAAQSIKDQISKELGVPLQYINSALVSAQNRQRFYAHNIPNVPQPEDRGILLRDILETVSNESRYTLAEPTAIRCRGRVKNGVGYAKYEARSDRKANVLDTNTTNGSMVAEPVRIGDIGSKAQAHRVYSCDGKSVCLSAGGGGQGGKTGLYACPVGIAQRTRDTNQGRAKIFEARSDLKSNAMTTVQTDCMVAYQMDQPIYEVQNGLITIKGKQYPIKLMDGYYIIRKLTVTEAARLQTMPDDYCRVVSATQAYKCLGNGWTAEVIMHILRHANIPLDEEIVVLSMYDGIATGRYCFDKLGYKNVKYYAYEIDKYAMQVAMNNYSDIVQCGDAFQVRNDDWEVHNELHNYNYNS